MNISVKKRYKPVTVDADESGLLTAVHEVSYLYLTRMLIGSLNRGGRPLHYQKELLVPYAFFIIVSSKSDLKDLRILLSNDPSSGIIYLTSTEKRSYYLKL